jgi:hypothetical protein
LAVTGEWLESDGERVFGALGARTFDPVVPESMRTDLAFRERSLLVTVNQLLGNEWAAGMRYRLSHADLQERASDSAALGFPLADHESTLHDVRFQLLYHHPGGLFAQFESLWLAQSNQGYQPDRPGG